MKIHAFSALLSAKCEKAFAIFRREQRAKMIESA
jgi:hypothetical protein